MLKTLNQCEDYIFSGTAISKRTSLYTMKKLMSSLGNPQDDLNYVHIAGSNGKGSTAMMLSTILVNSGYKVGLYTSPHLVKVNERIKINNRDISDKDFIKYTNVVVNKIKELKIEYNAFDIFTAIMFLYFKDKDLDIVIMETGLGGRLDSTNIIKRPLVSLITTLSLEHTSVLGKTINKIAKEKAGIIKEHSCVVYYPVTESTNRIIEDTAHKLNTKVVKVEFNKIKFNESSFDFDKYKNIKLNLLGDYQVYNACCVLKVLKELEMFGLNTKNIKKSFKEINWPGRLQIISKKPMIMLDGSHNPQGIKTVIPIIKKYKDITIVIGMYKEKDFKKFIDELLPYSNNFICVKPNNIRALEPSELKDYLISKDKVAKTSKSLKNTLRMLYNDSRPAIILGSLRLVGDIQKLLK